MRIFQIIFLLLLWTSSFAQSGSVRGRVIDSKTLEPLPFANVFLNNTTIGTVSDANGDFLLRNINQAGSYELVISFVGYHSTQLKLEYGTRDIDKGVIKLSPSEVKLNSVEVQGTRDKEWERKSKKFKKIFLGDDKASAESIITNPWVVDFPELENSRKFFAKATEPIEIDNNALGYKVFFYLSYFEANSKGYSIYGHARFNEQQAIDEAQRMKWENNRRLSYLRSRHHLFKAMIDQRIKGEGFYLYTDRANSENVNVRSPYFSVELNKAVIPFDTVDLVTPIGKTGVYRITLNGRLEVHYQKERASVRTYRDIAYPVSWIQAERGFVLVNKEGYELNPADVIISGAMSRDRVARMLPIDFKQNLIPETNEKNSLSHFQENIYVHTDKPYYYPGEAMWFKGYINYGESGLSDSLSKVVYAELINPQKQISQSKMLPIDSGFFHNDFVLPDTLTSGTYYLRAYTSLNRNFGDSNLYVKPIAVLSITDKVDPGQGKATAVQSDLLSMTTDKTSYKTREKILLTLRTKDKDGNPQSANLSISVTDAGQVVPIEEPKNIIQSFPIDEKDKKLTMEFKYPIDNGINFTGRFFNDKGKPERTILSIMQWNPLNIMLVETDEGGIFIQTGLSFYDSMKLSVKSDKTKDKPYGNIKLIARNVPLINFNENPFSLRITKTESPQRIIAEYEASKEVRMLDDIIVKGVKIIETQNTSTYGKPDVVVKEEDIKLQYDNLLNSLVGIPGVEVNAGFPGSIIIRRASGLSIYNANNPTERNSGPLVTIDDVPIAGKAADILATINPKTVARVEITKRINVLYGSTAGGGVVAVYTKTGTNFRESQKESNFQLISIKGYSRARDFKSPVYEEMSQETSADYRSTLYWNPEVITDEKGDASVSFYASDLPGSYHVVVEGVTEKGEPIRSEYYIDVDRD